MNPFFRFFAERHILATLITLMILILGLSTLPTIKRDIFPEVDFGWMTVTTRYPGASPEDVELNVTNKIEDELKGLSGIDRTFSVSMENVSVINVIIDIDEKDQEEIKRKIRESVDRVTDFPPEVTEKPLVQDWSTASFPIIEVGLTGNLSYRELREYARQLEKKLKDVPGVSRLEKFGYRDREIKVEVSPDKVREYQIPLGEIIVAIQARNIRVTAGNFESYTSEKNLVTLAQFQDPLEAGNVIVRSTFEGPLIKIKDLAVVKDDFEEERIISRINAKPAISFIVYKSENADIIRTVDAVKKLFEKEKENLPPEVEILYSMDQAVHVKRAFDVVRNNGLLGLCFVLIILTLFLNVRSAFWVALGIPVSLLGTIFLLPTFGAFLDTISLASMILIIGIIVDDAIIVGENIARRRELGDPPLKAAVVGIQEVFKPVFTTVLTTFIVFAPMFFMTGIFGKFLLVIPLVISLALFISLVEVTVALPAHLLPGLRRLPDKSSRSQSWFEFLRSRYRRIIRRILNFRYALVLFFILVLSAALWFGINHLRFVLFPGYMASEFYVVAELPTGSSLQATADKFKEVEDLIVNLPKEELSSFVTRIGYNPLLEAESEHYGSMAITLTPFSKRERSAEEIVEFLREKTDKMEGYEKISYFIESGGPPVGRPISIAVVGSDDELRAKLADSVEAFLKNYDGVKDVERDDKLGKDQVEIKVDYDKLSRMGLTVADVAQNVRIAYDGQVVTSVRYGDEDVDFRVIFEEKARKRLDYLKDLPIPNRQGRLIPLREVAWLKTGPGMSDYRHEKGERSITVEADVNKGVTTPVEVTDSVFAHINLGKEWGDTRMTLLGEALETEKSMLSLYRTFIIALIAIYFVLVLLFNNLTQPLLVMVAIPFGVIGVIIAFVLHNEPMSFVGMLGVIGLNGVVVNDSLVLVNHINELRRKKPEENFLDLVAEGTANRFRAVILTSLTTVVGLIPLAYGLGGTDPYMAPMALALGYGLLFATPLTLALVPCFYSIRHDIGRLLRRIFGISRKEGNVET